MFSCMNMYTDGWHFRRDGVFLYKFAHHYCNDWICQSVIERKQREKQSQTNKMMNLVSGERLSIWIVRYERLKKDLWSIQNSLGVIHHQWNATPSDEFHPTAQQELPPPFVSSSATPISAILIEGHSCWVIHAAESSWGKGSGMTWVLWQLQLVCSKNAVHHCLASCRKRIIWSGTQTDAVLRT